MTALSLLLTAIVTQSPAQSLTQEQTKPDPGQPKDDKIIVVVIPRPIFLPSDVRFVIAADGVFLNLNGVRIPMPGGGASGCFGDAVKTPDAPKPDQQKKP